MPAKSRPRSRSFCPPTPADHADGGSSRPRPWVLVDKEGYIAKRENATSASAPSNGGVTVEVCFCLADPPALSYLCAYCPDLEGRAEDGGFCSEPAIASAEGAFVLLHLRFNFGPRPFLYDSGMKDYFVYRAGPGKPWLRCLPDPFPRDFSPQEVGLLPLPCGGGGDGKEGFVVAALMPLLNPLHRPHQPFDLHLFSSQDGRGWRTVVPRLDQDSGRLLSHETSKVIVLGGGFMGWVDLWRGILICNVLTDDPVVSLISLPKPMVAKRWKCYPGLIRDVTCINNLVTCVEIQFPKTADDELPASYWDNTISDSDSDNDLDSDTSHLSCVSHTWTATMFKRRLFTSNNDWRMDSKVDSASILPTDLTCFDVIPELRDAGSGKFTLENINCSAPVITMYDDGVVYMMSNLDTTGSQEGAWVLAFDVRKNTLKALEPCSVRRIFDFDAIFCPCTFSKYLGMVSGEEPFDISANYIRREEKLHKQQDFLMMVLLSVHDQLKKFEKTLEFEINYRPMLHASRASSLHASIQSILWYAPKNGEDNEVVGKCIRALKDLEPWIAKSVKSHMPVSVDILTRKVNVSLAAIDTLLQTSNPEAIYNGESSSLGLSPQLGAISIY